MLNTGNENDTFSVVTARLKVHYATETINFLLLLKGDINLITF
jgi:hypothetical protein